jgi:hypothetical protein
MTRMRKKAIIGAGQALGGGMKAWRKGNGNGRVTAAAVLLAIGLMGCGGTGKSGPAPAGPGAAPVRVDEGGDLSELGKAVKTPEDQLVLDLMLGYRMLLLRNPDAKTLDKETLKKSRDAYDRLEGMLRHGGMKPKDAGERVYTVTNGDKLSLQEVIRSASQAAEKAAREGDWGKARERWKEITQSKTAVAFTMEEAQWGLALTDALQSSLADSLKKRLRDVNESYLSDAGYEEIGRQVKALLETMPDVKIQRELKKLANRAWERDKRAGRISPQSQQAQAAAAAGATVPPPDSAKGQPETTGTEAAQTPANALPAGEAAAIGAEADSLAGKGKYVAALKVLERGGPEQSWVKDKKAQIGDRFCEEKRRSAANSFKDYKKAADDAAKRNLLKRTAADLDSCLFYFPELPVSQKVRKNREMVETELKKLKGP